MVRLRPDGTFSVCAVGYGGKLKEYEAKNECPCVASWQGGGFLCAAWGSATPTIVTIHGYAKVISFLKPCTFQEAQTCPFFKDDEPANSKRWLKWVTRKMMLGETAEVIANHLTWLAVHGNLCLALRHPQNRGPSRRLVVDFTKELGKMLVQLRVVTEKQLKEAEKLEAEEGSKDLL